MMKEHPSEMYEYVRLVAENIAEYRFNKWDIGFNLSKQWEEILDGTYVEQASYPEYEEMIAAFATEHRTYWYNQLKSRIVVPVLINVNA